MPRAALLSIHARVERAHGTSWADPSLVQLWGPRFQVYVVAARDLALFSLGRLPDDPKGRARAEELAERLRDVLGGADHLTYGEAGRKVGVHPNELRYAAPTGTVLIRWHGAHAPTIWSVPRPDIDPITARLELARRYLHVFGPTTPDAFARWSSVRPRHAAAAFDALGRALIPVRTPIGEAWILAEDEPGFWAAPGPEAPARLLPSGDTYFLLWREDRELLVPEADRRDRLWTSRVWPGALVVGGELVGTWRRARTTVQAEPWRHLTRAERDAVETEAATFPLPGVDGPVVVRWDA
jgi:winged helix DNA-binding protein